MVYPFNRDKEISSPPLPKQEAQQDLSTVGVSRQSEGSSRFDAYDGSHNMESLNSNSRSEIGREREQANNSSNSLARKHPPLWINPLFVSSLKNQMLPKIPYALGLLGSAFIGMIFQPPVVPILKHLPYATNAFMQVMRAEENPIRGITNEQMQRLKEQSDLQLEHSKQLRRLQKQKQGNSSFSHNSKPLQELAVPESRNPLQKSPTFSPTKEDQVLIG